MPIDRHRPDVPKATSIACVFPQECEAFHGTTSICWRLNKNKKTNTTQHHTTPHNTTHNTQHTTQYTPHTTHHTPHHNPTQPNPTKQTNNNRVSPYDLRETIHMVYTCLYNRKDPGHMPFSPGPHQVLRHNSLRCQPWWTAKCGTCLVDEQKHVHTLHLQSYPSGSV